MGRTDKEIYRVIDNVNSYYRINSESKKELLLNKYPNAAAAYSLRLLDGYYRGPLVRVRRDDGVEVDVYPDYNNELSLDSLVTNVDAHTTEDEIPDADYTFELGLHSLGEFVGHDGYSSTLTSASTATVCVWYDQSKGNDFDSANNAEQDAASSQPLIYDSVSGIIKEGSAGKEKPAVYFADTYHLPINVAFAEPLTMASVHYNDITATEYLLGASDKPAFAYTSGRPLVVTDASRLGAPLPLSKQRLRIDRYSSVTGLLKIDIDGSQNLSATGVGTYTPSNTSSLGSYWRQGGSPLTETMQEFVLWPSYQNNSDKNDIQTNINSFYQIDGYTPPQPLLDEFGGAAAAYSLRLLSSTYNGPLVRIRRTIDNTEVDVYPDSDGEFSIYSTIQDGGTELTAGVTGGSTDKTTLHEFLYGQDTDCMVVRWYDQASGNHATQDVATSQPKIYDSVAGVVTENGKPAVNPQSRYGMPTGINGLTDLTVFAIGNNTFNGSQNFPRIISSYAGTGSLGANAMIFRYNSSTSEFNFNTSSGAVSISGSQPQNFLAIIRKTSNTIDIGLNGSVYSSATSTAALTDQIYLLEDVGGTQMEACRGINEIIIYNSSQSDANRTGIEKHINDYYRIY